LCAITQFCQGFERKRLELDQDTGTIPVPHPLSFLTDNETSFAFDPKRRRAKVTPNIHHLDTSTDFSFISRTRSCLAKRGIFTERNFLRRKRRCYPISNLETMYDSWSGTKLKARIQFKRWANRQKRAGNGLTATRVNMYWAYIWLSYILLVSLINRRVLCRCFEMASDTFGWIGFVVCRDLTRRELTPISLAWLDPKKIHILVRQKKLLDQVCCSYTVKSR